MFGVDPAVAGAALDGASLLGGGPPPTREFVVSQYHSNMQNTGTFMLRHRDGHKLVAYGSSPLGLEPAASYCERESV